MRVLSWNIGHGGGSRIRAICRHIEDVDADLIVLSEFRARNESSLRGDLARLGYRFIVTSEPVGNQNGLLVASRWQLDPVADQYEREFDRERWLALRLNELGVDVLAVHIPASSDNRFKGGYGVSGVKRKELLWERAIKYAIDHKDSPAIMMGDLNTGFRIDAEGAMFKLSHYMRNLIDIGFVDTWRHLHPGAREFTWYSRRKDKGAGRSEELNGFRLDYILVSPPLQDAIADAAILHEPRWAGVSDHASVVVDIDFQQDAYWSRPQRDESTNPPAHDGHIGISAEVDRNSTHGPCWTKESFLAAIATALDRDQATRLFELHDSHDSSYYWFGQRPNGAVFFHALGLRYAPMSVWINASGELMGRGAWSSYPGIRKHVGFADLASFVGQDHQGTASGFPVAEFDVERLWAVALECALRINSLQ